jgi:hypothetical protein
MIGFREVLCLSLAMGIIGCRTTNRNYESSASKAQNGDEGIIFLLGGQSNMAGQTPLPSDLASLKVPNVEIFCAQPHFFNPGQETFKSDYHTPSWREFAPCGVNDSTFGPEVTFAQKMHEAMPNKKIYLIKYAHGGTSQGCEWMPMKRSHAFNSYGESKCKDFLTATNKPADSMRTYQRFLKMAEMGRIALKSRGIEAKVGGMLWLQGEGDADGRAAYRFLSDTYKVNLPHFIRTVREDLQEPHMPFVIAKIKCGYSYAEWSDPNDSARPPRAANPLEMVRNTQNEVTRTEPNVSAFDTMDLQFQADQCHFDTPSMRTIGARFAEKISGISAGTPASGGDSSSGTKKSSDGYLICSGNKYCSGSDWGWLNTGEEGCGPQVTGFSAAKKGCSCRCKAQ